MFFIRLRLLLPILLALVSPVRAADQEVATTRFLDEVFKQVPQQKTLWLTGELRSATRAILDHDHPALRVRYWQLGSRTAWVLDEIGKEMPITVGISIDANAVERVRVLAYRESRGWEVKLPAFTRQFDGAQLTPQASLDRRIDGISGATLSVRALSRLTRLALLFHRHATAADASR